MSPDSSNLVKTVLKMWIRMRSQGVLPRSLAGLIVLAAMPLALVACGPSAPVVPADSGPPLALPIPALESPSSPLQGTQPQAPPPFTPSAPPFTPLPTRPTPASLEEVLRRRAEDEAALPGRRTSPTLSGPETRGKPIFVVDRVVQLPPDAYVESAGFLIGHCIRVDPQCPQGSLRGNHWLIRRGNSTISVLYSSGAITFRETIALGEEGAFNFLKEALR